MKQGSVWCPDCGEIALSGHKCPRVWIYRTWEDVQDGEPGITIYAYDGEEAAALAARKLDSEGDYIVAGGGELEIEIRRSPSGDPQWYSVTAVTEPIYSATPIEPPE